MHSGILRILILQQQKNCFYSTKMPKSKKNISQAKCKNYVEKDVTSKNDIRGAVYLGNNSEIVMKIHAKPGAKESAITDVGNEAIGVQIGAPPVDGEANKELIRYLAEVLKLRKSDITLDKGSRSKEKTIIISKDIALNNVLDALSAASKQ